MTENKGNQKLIEYKPEEAKVPAVPYRKMTRQLEYEVSRNVSQRQKDSKELLKLRDDLIVVPVKASAFLRSSKRKAKEPFEAYRRGLRNAKKALKVYLKWGTESMVLVDKDTMEVV